MENRRKIVGRIWVGERERKSHSEYQRVSGVAFFWWWRIFGRNVIVNSMFNNFVEKKNQKPSYCMRKI